MQTLKQIPMGWTSNQWLEFTDSLPKANDMQLEQAILMIRRAIYRREK